LRREDAQKQSARTSLNTRRLKLHCFGFIVYPGTAGDSFTYHRGAPFSTKDQDNDEDDRHCAATFKGGWWYQTCRRANLNGLYHPGQHASHADGINWRDWKGDYYSAKRSEMKIRPADFQ